MFEKHSPPIIDTVKQLIHDSLEEEEVLIDNPYYKGDIDIADDMIATGRNLKSEFEVEIKTRTERIEERFYRVLIKILYYLLVRRFFRNEQEVERYFIRGKSSRGSMGLKDKVKYLIALEYKLLCKDNKANLHVGKKERSAYFPSLPLGFTGNLSIH